MDELKIESGVVKAFLTKLIRKTIKDKTGINTCIRIRSLEVRNKDDAMTFTVSADGTIPTKELINVVSKNIGV